jgi:hypothetical protein
VTKYTPQDFIELIPKEFICSIIISECAVVVKDLGWREVTKTKVVDIEKLCNFVVYKFLI